jgi:uncharacterized membrane protein YcaP (DUF421 family)
MTASWVLPAAVATRTLVVAVVVIGALRLAGKHQLGQFTTFDLAAIMAIANGVQNAMTIGSGRISAGVASASALFVVAAVAARLAVLRPRAARRLVGSPTLLAYDGRIVWEHLRRCGVTSEEFEAAMRERGIASVAEVAVATLEPDGGISLVTNDYPTARLRRMPRRRGGKGPASVDEADLF